MRFKKNSLLTSEFHVKFHLKNRYRTHRFAIRAISVFRVKFNVEFTRQAVNFSTIYRLVSVSKWLAASQGFKITKWLADIVLKFKESKKPIQSKLSYVD